MRRNILTLSFAAVLGLVAFSSDASACHKKKCACPAPVATCAPAPVTYCAPAPVVACAPAPKKCGLKMPKMPKMSFGHKKAACAPATYVAAPTYVTATPQASGQGM